MSAEQVDLMEVPDGFTDLGWSMVLVTNFDHRINPAIFLAVQTGGCFARHVSDGFVGHVWIQDGRWHETVQILGELVATYVADTVEELTKLVNDEHGWD